MAENFFTDYPERKDQLFKYSRLESLIQPLEEAFGEKDAFKDTKEAFEMYSGVLEEIGKLCALEIKPSAAKIDLEGTHLVDGEVQMSPTLQSQIRKCAELGVFSGQGSRQVGGFNLPSVVQVAALEMFAQACPNTGLTVAAYSMISFVEKWGTEEQKSRLLPKLLNAEYATAMALTESNAGSDLGNLRTSAKKDGDKYLVNGTKQFISYGHGEVVMTLVRTDPNSKGLEGLSVLWIPKTENGKKNISVSKIEDKVCLHASPTCELVFENSVGELFGPEGQGFKVMLDLMNGARLAMGALSLGICTAALSEAKKYANERTTFGKPIFQHPMVADMIFEMEVEIRAMRALVYETACASDYLRIAEKNNNKHDIKKWKQRFRRLTPLCKYMVSEKAVTITKNAVQIFGGYGVCREYPVERLWRESLIYPIYEGTSQIQSLMVLKDTLKDVAQQASGFMGSLAGALALSKVTRDPVKREVLKARNELNLGIKTILGSVLKDKFRSDIDSLKENKIQDFFKDFSLNLLTSKTDLTFPFLVAERFCRITCDYYALKCMTDHHDGNPEWEKWILAFSEMAIPRMQLENHYMVHRLPLTLEYMKQRS